MAQRALEQRVEHLEHRVASVEQILPTLATKVDLATLEVELKADSKARAEETRRHFDVVAEGLRAEIRVLADGVAAGQASFARVDARHEDVMRVLEQHDRRLIPLEASQKRR